jgi:membrane protease subunit (stomatin/prohibitin family)
VGLFDGLRHEFIDIIEWLDDSRDTIVWRFPRHDNEIKMGAKLIVRESQNAVFVNEGQIADTFTPGTHTLETRNLPILTTLKSWPYGFDSPFKAEVYFVNTRQFTDLKWGTQNPVIVRDPEFGMVRLRAFGAYAMRVTDPAKLLRELVGTDAQFRTEEVSDYLRQMIVSKLGTALATSGVSLLDMSAHQQGIGQRIAGVLSEDLANLGITVTNFIIENISVPPEVEEALDKRTQMGVVGDLDQYTKFQTAEAIEEAAKNPGGGGAEGLGMGVGLAVGQRMAEQLRPQQQTGQTGQGGQGAAAPTPPPVPVVQWYLGIDGQQHGPFDGPDLPGKVASGQLTPDTLVWTAGMEQWQPAREIAALAPVLSIAPPPLPMAPPGRTPAPSSDQHETRGADAETGTPEAGTASEEPAGGGPDRG